VTLLDGEQVLPDEVRGFRRTDPASRKVGDEVVCLGLANHEGMTVWAGKQVNC
jgi:hypothetical protein